MIAQFESEAVEDPEAAMRLMDAEETLFLLGQRIESLKAQKGDWFDLEKLGIEDPPRLYAKGAQSPPEIKGWYANRARARFGEQIDDPDTQRKLQKLGYILHREGSKGPIFRIVRHPKMAGKLPHLQVKGDRSIAEGEGIATFAERKADAGLEWRTTKDDLHKLKKQLDAGKLGPKEAQEARLRIQAAGPKFRYELEVRIVRGDIDEESAGLVAKWGAVIERLESDSAAGATQRFTMDMFMKRLPKGSLTEVQVDEFRRYIRRSTLDYIESLERPKDRMDALYRMLDLQPDPGSKGELFHSYRTRFMEAEIDIGGQKIYDVDPVATTRFLGKGLKNPRTPDAVVDVRPDVKAHLPPGRYAIEDKTGEGAFKLDQAEDYAKRSYPKAGGFKATPYSKKAEYDGLVYVFSRRSEAVAALKQLRGSDAAPILGKHPGGIHVMYFSANGRLEPLRP